MLEQVIDIPIDPCTAVIPGQVEEMGIETNVVDAVCHSLIIPQ